MSNFRILTFTSWHTTVLPHTTINTSKYNRNERPGKHRTGCSRHRTPKSKERHTTINTSKPSSKHQRLPNRQNIPTDNSPIGKLGKAGDVVLFAPSARQQHLCAEQRRRRSQSTSSWAQRAFMQTFTIAVIDSPVACVGVDLSSKACLPLPDLVSDISGTVYHDQHQQIRFLYQRRMRDGSDFPSCLAPLIARPQLSFRVLFLS